MLSLIKYPICHKSFMEFVYSNNNYVNIYEKMNLVVFDTTLRDGLQNVKQHELYKYSTLNKIELYNKIINQYEPKYIEIGSIVSNKYFPIFSDSIEIFIQTKNFIHKNFLLIPSLSKLNLAIDNGCNNFSFISSVSESFQLANTNKNLEQTKKELFIMINQIRNEIKLFNPKIKIYISCVNCCPTQGKISNDFIVNEIDYYYKTYQPDIICLSDTCSFLTFDDFTEIIEKLNNKDIDFTKLSIHLHIDYSNSNYYYNLQKIFNACIDNKITHFDISFLETGGCTMTLNDSNIKPNLSYKLYYKLLVDYIISKC